MTNFEKVKECMRIEDVPIFGGLPCNIIHKIKNEENCSDRSCEECKQWLAEEYVAPVELTEAERVILENIDKEYEYIARDGDTALYIYQKQPIKEYGYWNCEDGVSLEFDMYNHLFQFVQWEDEEPYSIEELLKE